MSSAIPLQQDLHLKKHPRMWFRSSVYFLQTCCNSDASVRMRVRPDQINVLTSSQMMRQFEKHLPAEANKIRLSIWPPKGWVHNRSLLSIPHYLLSGYLPFTSHLASRQVLPALSACRLKVYFGSGALWLAVSQSEAQLLQNYAIGNSEGGPDTAVQTSLTLGPSQHDSLQVT